MKYRIGMAVIAFILAGSFLFAACGGKASITEKQEADSRDRPPFDPRPLVYCSRSFLSNSV